MSEWIGCMFACKLEGGECHSSAFPLGGEIARFSVFGISVWYYLALALARSAVYTTRCPGL